MKTLYHTMVFSHLSYSVTAWGNGVNKNKISILQKKAIRIINKRQYRSHTEPLFKEEELLKFEDHYQHMILLFMHKLKNNKLPNSFNNFLQLNETIIARRTRQSELFYHGRARTSFSSKLPIHNFPKIWNDFISTNRELLHVENHKQFKKNSKAIFINAYAELIQCHNQNCVECYSI